MTCATAPPAPAGDRAARRSYYEILCDCLIAERVEGDIIELPGAPVTPATKALRTADRPAILAALVNGLIVEFLPAGVVALHAIAESVGLGARSNGVTVHPVGWTPWVPTAAAVSTYGLIMLPFAAVAAWRTWVHAKRRRESGAEGWQGVAEAAACGFLTLIVLLLRAIVRQPLQAVPYVIVYGGLAALIGLVLGVVLRMMAVLVLYLTRRH